MGRSSRRVDPAVDFIWPALDDFWSWRQVVPVYADQWNAVFEAAIAQLTDGNYLRGLSSAERVFPKSTKQFDHARSAKMITFHGHDTVTKKPIGITVSRIRVGYGKPGEPSVQVAVFDKENEEMLHYVAFDEEYFVEGLPKLGLIPD